MQTMPRKKPSLAKRILKVVVGIVVGTALAIGAVLGLLIFLPWSSDGEPKTPKAIKDHFNLTLPVQAQVLDDEWYHPMGSFGYYAVIRLPQEDVASFLDQPGMMPYPPTQEANERKQLLNEWDDMNWWHYRAASKTHHSKIATNGLSEVFVDLDDPKFATVYTIAWIA